MAYQTGRQILVAYNTESSFNVLASPTGAKVFRPAGGKLELTREMIESNENRRDGMTTRGRPGSRKVTGSYFGDLALGAYDPLIEATLRGTFDAGLTLTGLSLTADAAAKTITRSSGSWITDGVRIGDVVRFTGWTTTANNGRNFRVTALTATVMTVAEAPTTVSPAQTAVGLTRAKKVLQGMTARSSSFEEAELDIDGSEVFTGIRASRMQIELQSNGIARITFDFVGADMQVMTGAQSPYFTTPTTTTSIGVTAVEAVIRLGSVDVVDLTALNLSVDLRADGIGVIGSQVTPEVFTNPAVVTASFTALRQDLTRMQNALNEDQLSLHLLFTENESEPKDYLSFFVGNLALTPPSKSDLGTDGPRTQQINLMIGVDERGGAYHNSMVSFQTSAT